MQKIMSGTVNMTSVKIRFIIQQECSIHFLLLLLILSISGIDCSMNNDLLPKTFFGMTLVQRITGDEAKQFLDKLHFQPIAPKLNEIGFYEGSPGKAIIYVTHYDNENQAASEANKMTEKISPENSAFFSGQYQTVRGKDVYRCFGMGQTHFVFTNNNQLFWISVDTHIGRKFLEEYLDYLFQLS
jgi:hypothetical protein